MSAAPVLQLRVGRLVVDAACGADPALLGAAIEHAVREALLQPGAQPASPAREATATQRVAGSVGDAVARRAGPILAVNAPRGGRR